MMYADEVRRRYDEVLRAVRTAKSMATPPPIPVNQMLEPTPPPAPHRKPAPKTDNTKVWIWVTVSILGVFLSPILIPILIIQSPFLILIAGGCGFAKLLELSSACKDRRDTIRIARKHGVSVAEVKKAQREQTTDVSGAIVPIIAMWNS